MQASGTFRALLAAAAIATATVAAATGITSNSWLVPVPDTDNGLGQLPHYTKWQEPWLYAIPAESLDSGLGELAHYTKWQEPWLYAIPAEKLDNGLGELPPFRTEGALVRRDGGGTQ